MILTLYLELIRVLKSSVFFWVYLELQFDNIDHEIANSSPLDE